MPGVQRADRQPAGGTAGRARQPAPRPAVPARWPPYAHLGRATALVAFLVVVLGAAVWNSVETLVESRPDGLLWQVLAGPALTPLAAAPADPGDRPGPRPADAAAGPRTAWPAAGPETPAGRAPDPPVAAVLPAAPAAPTASVAPPASLSAGSRERPGRPRRYALEFGPFGTAAEAERVERRLSQAGHPTVRFRRDSGADLFGTFVGPLPGVAEAQAVVSALAHEGFPEAVVHGTGQAVRVRVGEPRPLREAVALAERLRGAGHPVRVLLQPGEAVVFYVRLGNFGSREEAEEWAAELAGLDLEHHLVRVR